MSFWLPRRAHRAHFSRDLHQLRFSASPFLLRAGDRSHLAAPSENIDRRATRSQYCSCTRRVGFSPASRGRGCVTLVDSGKIDELCHRGQGDLGVWDAWQAAMAHVFTRTLQHPYKLARPTAQRYCLCERDRPNQLMKPTAPLRNESSVLATAPCRGLSLNHLTMRWSERRTDVHPTFEMISTLPLRAQRRPNRSLEPTAGPL